MKGRDLINISFLLVMKLPIISTKKRHLFHVHHAGSTEVIMSNVAMAILVLTILAPCMG